MLDRNVIFDNIVRYLVAVAADSTWGYTQRRMTVSEIISNTFRRDELEAKLMQQMLLRSAFHVSGH